MKNAFSKIRFKNRSTSAALGLAAAVMLVPANLLPVLTTESFGNNRTDTILSGAVELWRQGLWAIAAIVFTASILIPVLKLAGLASLLFSVFRGTRGDPRQATCIYAALDFIGRWSMLDVFLAAFLMGLVQFGEIAKIEPRSGLVFFAAAVVLTMLATHTFDPREIWRDQGAPSSV